MLETPQFKSEYPFKSNFLDLDGLKYHYLDEGKGDPIIMVHGNPSWSFYYRKLVGELRSKYRVIVPDHIGCGLSDKPADSQYTYSLEQRIDDLDTLITSLKLKRKVTLVVHDWGGMIGMGWAIRHPDKVARLIILNTAAFHLPAAKKFPLALKLCRNTQFGSFLVQGFNVFARGAAWVGCKRKRMSSALQQMYCFPYDNWQHRIATLRFIQDIPLQHEDRGYSLISEIDAGLEQFAKLPMLICWGELDFVFDTSFLTEWQRRFPHAKVHSYTDCGHYILEDCAFEVVPLIKQFLQDNRLPTS